MARYVLQSAHTVLWIHFHVKSKKNSISGPPECQFFRFTSMKLDISIFMHDILGKFSIGHIGNLDFEAWDFFLFNPLTPVFKKIHFLSTGIQNTIRPF